MAGSQEASLDTVFAVKFIEFNNILNIYLLCLYQDIEADEENVRKVSSHLKDVVLPKFIQDLCTLEVSPMDGQTLTEALHAHGINVRYMGKVSIDVSSK